MDVQSFYRLIKWDREWPRWLLIVFVLFFLVLFREPFSHSGIECWTRSNAVGTRQQSWNLFLVEMILLEWQVISPFDDQLVPLTSCASPLLSKLLASSTSLDVSAEVMLKLVYRKMTASFHSTAFSNQLNSSSIESEATRLTRPPWPTWLKLSTNSADDGLCYIASLFFFFLFSFFFFFLSLYYFLSSSSTHETLFGKKGERERVGMPNTHTRSLINVKRAAKISALLSLSIQLTISKWRNVEQ